jgi:DNA-binding CsgD family transcriptional regulator
MPIYLKKLHIITQYLAESPTLDELANFLSIHHCPSGEVSSVYFAKVTPNKSLIFEAVHGFQSDEFVQVGREIPIESTRPSGRSIIENRIIFDEIDPNYYLQYPALINDGNTPYPWSTKISMPINVQYFLQICRYCSFLQQDKEFYQNIQSLLQIYFSKIGKVALEIGDLSGKPLTERQADILALIIKGMTNDEIAIEIGYSSSLVKQESMLIFSKLGISGRKGLMDLS